VTTRWRGVLFDLFGTLIGVESERLPELEIDGRRVRTTVGALGPLLTRWLPGVIPVEFLNILLTVSDEMARARAYDHIEWPSRERFRRALERAGMDDEAARAEAAAALSRAHMAAITAATVCPPAHLAFLRALRSEYRLGLVSNFDDTGTAYDILFRHGILPYLDTVVISEALGLRKPHPALARAGFEGLHLPAHEVLFVGDTFGEDIVGARAAGIEAACRGLPVNAEAPRYVLRSLIELAPVLEVDLVAPSSEPAR
jgi:putative hydrolase of the HAD superfamily